MALDQETDPDLSFRVIGAAIEVHRRLGPGLLESTYRACLAHELALQGLRAQSEVPIRLEYKGIQLDSTYRADLIVQDLILLELKAADQILPVHYQQIITYLKLSGLKTGLLINFNVTCLKNGIRRFANARSSTDRAAAARPSALSGHVEAAGIIPAPP